ncbi:MAG: hypothetical protein LBQ02_00095 [Candidatus Nomurabacteria bacterium]|jgi:hypothetical protein|nr:hypothetical protein [Candidatus Nomurabacteria bacterium]
MNNCPCVPECRNRTVTCKFDGSCEKYGEWRATIDQKNEKTKQEIARYSELNDVEIARWQGRDNLTYHRYCRNRK